MTDRAAATGRPVTIRVDGASRGNPGPAGIGVVVEADGAPLAEVWEYLGETTNNVAEYRALLRGLDEAQKLSPGEIVVLSDSELLVRQLTGVYKVKAAHLKALNAEAGARLRAFPAARILHVRREENRRADLLANRAIDEHMARISHQGS